MRILELQPHFFEPGDGVGLATFVDRFLAAFPRRFADGERAPGFEKGGREQVSLVGFSTTGDEVAVDVGQPCDHDIVHDPHFLMVIIHQRQRFLRPTFTNGIFSQRLRSNAQRLDVIQSQHPAQFFVVCEVQQNSISIVIIQFQHLE